MATTADVPIPLILTLIAAVHSAVDVLCYGEQVGKILSRMTLMLLNAGFRVARAIYAESHLRDSWNIVSAAGLDEGDCGRLAGDW